MQKEIEDAIQNEDTEFVQNEDTNLAMKTSESNSSQIPTSFQSGKEAGQTSKKQDFFERGKSAEYAKKRHQIKKVKISQNCNVMKSFQRKEIFQRKRNCRRKRRNLKRKEGKGQ